MRTKFYLFLSAGGLLLLAFSLQPLALLAQGSLTPPGPPGPTMLTLSQIEPRTPISGPITISKPGSYYLTTNITISAGSAIIINANNITLDLNGFTISSTASPASGYAIYIGGVMSSTNIIIKNGFIAGGVTNSSSGVFGGNGFGYGIYGAGFNLQVKNIAVSGCLYDGINLNISSSLTVVEACTVNTAGGNGIIACLVSDSTAANCGNDGIDALDANNCYGGSLGTSSFYSGLYAGTANNCQGYNAGSGYGLSGNIANNCLATSQSGTGVSETSANNCYGICYGNGTGLEANAATGCYGFSEGNGTGLFATTAASCYGASVGSGTGLNASDAENCYGQSATGGFGLYANIAHNCYGQSNTYYGLYAYYAATSCYGASFSGDGLYAGNEAIGCTGDSSTGHGLDAYLANSCFSNTGDSGIIYKYNMP